MNSKVFPVRLEPEEIEASRDQIKSYVVLPVPSSQAEKQFETIGRTTFKKFIIKAYETLFTQNSFHTPDFLSIPFIISRTCKIPYIVHTKSQNQTETQINNPSQSQAKVEATKAAPNKQPLQGQRQLTSVQMTDLVHDADGGYYAPAHRKQIDSFSFFRCF